VDSHDEDAVPARDREAEPSAMMVRSQVPNLGASGWPHFPENDFLHFVERLAPELPFYSV
jgi:hypothetical protein